MIEKELEGILEKMKCNRWEEKQVFAPVSLHDLKDFIISLKGRFNTRLTSISAVEHSEYVELFYHLIVDNVPLNLITKVPKKVSFQSIKDLMTNATVYEEELQRVFQKGS
jgi:NADH:ubiquinone oxidoreductase subunit C